MADKPEVAWLCRCIGRLTAAFMALTSSPVVYGVSRPAMSLMAMVSQPMASISLCQIDKVGYVVHRAGGIADSTLRHVCRLFHGLDGNTQIAQIVHRVEDAEYVYAVVGGFLDKRPHHIIGVVAVAEQVLAAQQHLDAAVRQRLAQFLQTFPRIFLEVAHASVEGGATPGLQ